MSSAEQVARCPVANELFEKSGYRRVEIYLAKAVRSLEPLFNPKDEMAEEEEQEV